MLQGQMGPRGEPGLTGAMGPPGPQGPNGLSLPGEPVSLPDYHLVLVQIWINEWIAADPPVRGSKI